jgi:hypothetical protein
LLKRRGAGGRVKIKKKGVRVETKKSPPSSGGALFYSLIFTLILLNPPPKREAEGGVKNYY